MSRILKFRAWDKIARIMSEPFTLQEAIDEDAVCMQFTGLHYKNRKEIYEGDILSPNEREVLWKSNTRIGTVFNCAGWYTRAYKTTMRPEELGCFTFGITQAEVGEVVGNIYESPDQLKRKMESET